MKLTEEYWNNTISNPNIDIEIQRKVLWSILNVITATPFELRDEHWKYASEIVAKLLNESK